MEGNFAVVNLQQLIFWESNVNKKSGACSAADIVVDEAELRHLIIVIGRARLSQNRKAYVTKPQLICDFCWTQLLVLG